MAKIEAVRGPASCVCTAFRSFWRGFRSGNAMAMSTSPLGVTAIQQAWRATTRISLATSLPALQLRSSSVATPVPPWPRSDCSPSMLHRIRTRLRDVQPVNAWPNVAGETVHVAEQTVMGLPTRLDCRQQLQCRQRCRSFSLVCAAGAQDVCAITHLKSPWPVYPFLSMRSPSHGSRCSGQIRCSSHSSVWKRSAPSANASVDLGGTQTIEQLWEEYFADASQWWNNRFDKKNPRSPDLKHKVRRKELWIDGWSTPGWVKARLTPMTLGRLQCHADYGSRDFEDTAQGKKYWHGHVTPGIEPSPFLNAKNRPPMGNNGEGNTLPTRAREWRQLVQGGGGSMDVKSASTTSEAIAILKNRLQQGIPIKSYMYVDVLKRCLKEKDLLAVKQVHDCIIKSGMYQNTYVANRLLSVYIRCGRLQDARRVFDGLVKKDVIRWNVMIGGYAQRNHANAAMQVFHQMRQENVEPNEITYLSILKACARPSALKWGKEVHAYIRHAGLESNVRVGTALLQMYAKCGCIKEARHIFDELTNADVFSWNVMIGAYVESGSIDDARLVFDRMEDRNVITWTLMIGAYAKSGCGEEAYHLFLQMIRKGFKPDAITYISILNACASAGALVWVKEVHGHALEAGLESDLRVGNALMHMYAKSGSIDDAQLFFDRMEERNVIAWNVMIGAYAESGCGEEAYRLFLQMKREGFKPDAITYISILNACASLGALAWVKDIHSHALEAGLESDLRVGNALIHMYAKSGSIDDARLVFDRMEKRDVVTWNAMIGAYAESGCGEEAYRLFLQMKRDGFKPGAITYVSILNACASAGALEWVKEVHGHALEARLESDLRVGNALIHMYAKSGSIDDARLVFDRMERRDVITWNVLIGGLAQHGCGHEALEKLRNMNRDGVKPDGRSLVAVLSACSHAGLLDDGRRLFLAMTQDYGIKPNTVLCNCMVDLFGRAGHLEEAMLFIGNMPVEPDGATWGALLGGCRTQGNVEMAEFAAKERLKLEPSHAGTYVLLSNMYAAAGKWDQVSLVRTMMQERGIRKEPGRSWIEVDNKIHRFVVGDTSHPETKEIYAELNRLTERIKAEGYIPDTRLVLQNIDEEDKELALCSHSEKLAIAYGLMRTGHGKPIRVYKNLRVCSDCHTATKFISKVTGREIVARDANRFHNFKDGVCSCGDYW